MAGVLSFLLVDLDALIAILPFPDGQRPEMPPWYLLKFASVAQPAVLTTVAVLAGLWMAPKVGLRAPAAEAFASGESYFSALRPQILPGIVAGVSAGFLIVLSWVIVKPHLPEEFVTRSEAFNKMIPAVVRFLYGGLTEEVLLRWGMMSFLVWFLSALLRREGPANWMLISAILFSSLLFGAGHLPVASLLNGGLTPVLTLYVIGANALFGIFAGFLYWKRGLESAMIAHIFAHIVLLSAVNITLE